MKKTNLLLLATAVLVALAFWAVPTILKAMPSRYVARLPEPLQQLGVPDDSVPLLPTVAMPTGANALLEISQPTVTVSNISQAVPNTPTSIPTKGAASAETTPTPTIQPTATPPPTATPWPIPISARLDGIQHKFQSWNNCGPATVAMALTYFDMQLTQADTASVLKPNPEDRNVSPHELAAYVNDHTPNHAAFRVNGDRATLQRLVANNIPVIVEIGIEPPGDYRWLGWYGHYLLLVAYDDVAEQFWVYDSWFGTSEEPLTNAHTDGRALSYATLEEFWPHFNRNYIAIYQPEQVETAVTLIGPDMDDATMWQNALTSVQAETAADPDNAFLWFNLGTIYNALEQYDSAATAFDQARAIGLPWRMLWYQFGPYQAYYENGRYDDVLLLTEVTLKDRPYFEESYYYRSLALAALGDETGARENLERAAAFNPNFTLAKERLGTGD